MTAPNNFQRNSQKLQDARVSTTSPIRDSREATRDSLLNAILGELSDGTLVPSSFAFEDAVPANIVTRIAMLVFGQDVPVQFNLGSVVNGGFTQAVDAAGAPVADVFAYTPPFLKYEPVSLYNYAAGILTQDANAELAGLNQALVGNLAADPDIYVQGYLGIGDWEDPQAATAALPGGRIGRFDTPSGTEIVSGGAFAEVTMRNIVDYGPPPYALGDGDLNEVGYIPVILLHTDYTAEMQASNNSFVDNAGNTIVVVGLHNSNPDEQILANGFPEDR